MVEKKKIWKFYIFYLILKCKCANSVLLAIRTLCFNAFCLYFPGLIEVELQEDDDGQITLIGYPLQGDNSGQRSGKRLQRSSPKPYERGTSPNSSGSETDNSQSPVLPSRNKHASRSDNSYR